MEQDKLKEYAEIREQLVKLEARKKELEKDLVVNLKDLAGPLKTTYGTFVRVVTRKYEFPANIYPSELLSELIKAEDNLKKLKEEEKNVEREAVMKNAEIPFVEQISIRYSSNK